ncbi:M56 family metallopeptidase [Aquimarina sp. MMG016]|uniref:M56 family metallopeptidase n=1 Tax=Aquimarina sp. MMG016 TaxID=2822690 RepID=UPI001B3A4B58|nr:M56 family metallopeptidase [Aquimarina sp. MMG016]MBQ4820908.1 hypothetical protein [Aquimarina sp. MMG016]
MIAYLIKSSLCLLVLGTFYKLFLEKEKIHNLKRYYLIFSMMFAYTIPLMTFTYEKEVYINPEEILVAPVEVTTNPGYTTKVYQVVEKPTNYLSILLWTIYGIGVIVFTFRFIRNIYNLTQKVRSNEKLREQSHTNVLLGGSVIPHTFLKYIFVSKTEFLQKAIPEEVLFHEKAHVNQRHTLDILFVEVLQVIFWFNPLLFWIKKSIKLNHEFLADQTVLKHQFSIQHYVNLLVSYPSSSNQTALTSTINYSLTKKRLQMMTKEFSKKRVALKLLAVLPVLLLCVLFFNNEIVAQEKNNWSYSKTTSTQDKDIEIRVKNEQIRVNGISVTLDKLANTIDDLTKTWEDDELAGFNFNVKLQNVNDEFLDKVNNAYRSTRLYKANPDHDLIPPAPPVPPSLRVRKGEVSDLPSPARAPKSPKAVGKFEKGIAPTPPTPPLAPTSEEMEDQVEQAELAREYAEVAEMEAEQEAAIAMVEAEEALAEAEMIEGESRENTRADVRKAERVQELARRKAAIAAKKAERSRSRAMQARERNYVRAQESQVRAREAAEKARAMAMEQSKKSREQAEKVRAMARMEAQVAREEAQIAMKLERERARSEAALAREEAQLAMKMERSRMRMQRENLGNEEELKKLEKEMRKLEKETKKKIEKARKKQLEATKKLKETQQKAQEKRMKALKKHKESLDNN